MKTYSIKIKSQDELDLLLKYFESKDIIEKFYFGVDKTKEYYIALFELSSGAYFYYATDKQGHVSVVEIHDSVYSFLFKAEIHLKEMRETASKYEYLKSQSKEIISIYKSENDDIKKKVNRLNSIIKQKTESLQKEHKRFTILASIMIFIITLLIISLLFIYFS